MSAPQEPEVGTPIHDQLAQDFRDGLAGPIPAALYADENRRDPEVAGSSPEEPPPGVDALSLQPTRQTGD